MKILVYGVHHWFDKTSSDDIAHLREWRARIEKYIPASEIFIATGCYSDSNITPFERDIPIIQNKIPYTQDYSVQHNYFRNGFITGIWNALLNHHDWDVLLHIQPRVLLGVPMQDILKIFLQNEHYQVLAPNFFSEGTTGLEISFFGMKPGAAKIYANGGARNSFMPEKSINQSLNTEEEAYLLFHEVRYNPWPDVFTTRQIDQVANGFGVTCHYSSFTMTDKQEFGKLPLISTGKHALGSYIKHWKALNPI